MHISLSSVWNSVCYMSHMNGCWLLRMVTCQAHFLPSQEYLLNHKTLIKIDKHWLNIDKKARQFFSQGASLSPISIYTGCSIYMMCELHTFSIYYGNFWIHGYIFYPHEHKTVRAQLLLPLKICWDTAFKIVRSIPLIHELRKSVIFLSFYSYLSNEYSHTVFLIPRDIIRLTPSVYESVQNEGNTVIVLINTTCTWFQRWRML